MSYYHIIIQQERRTPRVTEFGEDRSRMALQISTTKMLGEKEVVIDRTQLHTMSAAGLPENITDAQFVGVFEWDGSAPYVIAHKGDYSTRTMHYSGWPDLTKEAFDALPRHDPL